MGEITILAHSGRQDYIMGDYAKIRSFGREMDNNRTIVQYVQNWKQPKA